MTMDFNTDNSCTSHSYKHGCIKSRLSFEKHHEASRFCDLYSHFSSQLMVKSMRGVRGLFVMLIYISQCATNCPFCSCVLSCLAFE